jgi:CheY-like chemotaxis protein
MPKSPALAFLSYTRKDDEFFGGYITAFRKMLENAVQVVTGETSFQVFQDIDGIVIGENWEKKLDEAIHGSSFFVPMLSPLFFNSKHCREEVEKFLEHERALKRSDLILPIYFLTTAKLEKEEEKTKDPLATEFAKRQLFDWRQQANVPLQDPAGREAILALARAVANALERLENANALKRLEVVDAIERLEVVDAIERSEVGDALERLVVKQTLPELGHEISTSDARLMTGIPAEMLREKLNPRKVLWVDDNPDNNIWERQALESYGVEFTLAQSTAEAVQKWQDKGPFTAIISDMGRVGDAQAGYTLLSIVREAPILVPYFIYTAANHEESLSHDAKVRGTQGLTSDPDTLVAMVVAAIR